MHRIKTYSQKSGTLSRCAQSARRGQFADAQFAAPKFIWVPICQGPIYQKWHIGKIGEGSNLPGTNLPRTLKTSIVSSVRNSNGHPDLLLIHHHHHHHPLFQITPVLNTGLSLSEPLQLYKGYNAI